MSENNGDRWSLILNGDSGARWESVVIGCILFWLIVVFCKRCYRSPILIKFFFGARLFLFNIVVVVVVDVIIYFFFF